MLMSTEVQKEKKQKVLKTFKQPFGLAYDRNLTAKSPVKENNSYNTAKYGIQIIIENTIYSRKRNDIIEFE